MITYEKVYSFKMSYKQWDHLQNYSSEKGKDPSVILRGYIDSLGTSREQIIEEIQYHKYRMDCLNNILKSKDSEEKKKQEKEELLKLEEEKNELNKKETIDKNNNLKKLKQSIITELTGRFGTCLTYKDDEEKNKISRDVYSILKQKVENLDESTKEKLFDELIFDVNRFILNLSQNEIDGLKVGITK